MPVAQRMPAWVQRGYGGVEQLERVEEPIPEPARGTVLVKIAATALNAGDARLLRADPALVRVAMGWRRPRTAIRGMDVAGTVVALGLDASSVRLGDAVFAEVGGGGLATHVVVRAARLSRIPTGLEPAAAASIPIAGGTASQALDAAERVVGELAGRRVLVIGATGGVGTFAVQLAAQRGAEVWATCGAHTVSLVHELGAARAVDYRNEPITGLAAGCVDVALVIAGSAPLSAIRRLLRPGGVGVLVSGGSGGVLGPLPWFLRAAVGNIGRSTRLVPLAATAKPEVNTEIAALMASGKVRAVIERIYSLEQTPEAMTRLLSGRTVGKLVIRP